MKLKLSEIVNSVEALNELVKVKMPVKASYAISRNIKKLAPILEAYNEKRNELMKELGTPDEKGEKYTFSKENAEKFQTETKNLLDAEEEVDIHKLKIEDLAGVDLEPRLLVDFMFDE